MQANELLIFRKQEDVLLNIKDSSWSYKIDEKNPLVEMYKSRGANYINNPENDLLLMKDHKLKSVINYGKNVIWTYALGAHLVIISISKMKT